MEKLVYTVNETAQILNIGMNKAYELVNQEQKENMAKMLNECIPLEDFSGVRSSLENEEK